MTEPTRREWHEGRQMAAALTARHPEVLKDVPPLSDILFVIDTEATPKKDGRPVEARVSKIPGKFTEFVAEGNCVFMLEWFTLNQTGMSINQKHVLMIHELLHFECDRDKDDYPYKLRGHDFEDFRILLDRFGYRWDDPRCGDVPDVLSPGFTWGKQGQAKLDLSAPVGTPPQTTGIHLQSTERATLHVGPDSPPTLTVDGPDGTREIPAMTTLDPAKIAEWEPEQPLVDKSKVIDLASRRTGTDSSD